RLIEACQEGDREAFRQLFEIYQDRVWSIARHYAGDEVAARDLTQQVFLKLFTGIAQFRHGASFETWLYRLVVNACLDERRRRRRFISLDLFGTRDRESHDGPEARPEIVHGSGPGSEPEDHCARREISEAVVAAIRELKPKLRIAILLKHFEELSYQEMAQVLGCSTGTVASRLNRGHRELARKLAHLRGAFKTE
ncbi:MAG TPA: sigma-70 family RNA polymerase sigma factor, partial [Blastocatellia bacterium]|nr:sigma-70 family RNA polymerase sigma factor [Blastocatellia bacterium]